MLSRLDEYQHPLKDMQFFNGRTGEGPPRSLILIVIIFGLHCDVKEKTILVVTRIQPSLSGLPTGDLREYRHFLAIFKLPAGLVLPQAFAGKADDDLI